MGGRGSGRNWSEIDRKQLVERCVPICPNVILSPQVDAHLKEHGTVTGYGTSERGTLDFVLTLDAWGDYWSELSGHGSHQELRIVKGSTRVRVSVSYRVRMWPKVRQAVLAARCLRLQVSRVLPAHLSQLERDADQTETVVQTRGPIRTNGRLCAVRIIVEQVKMDGTTLDDQNTGPSLFPPYPRL